MKIDLKTVVMLLSIASTLGGFYYTTNLRLDALEAELEELHKSDARLKKLVRKLSIKKDK